VTRLVLVRHGESVAQVEGYVSGHDTCRGLSPLGRRQAEALRDRLSRTGEISADVILTSHLQRAVETAEMIAPAIGGHDLVQDCDLCELHPGGAEGLTFDEAQRRWPGDAWGPGMGVAPDGETWDAFETRVVTALGRYAEAHAGQTIVAVVHGGVIGHAWKALAGADVHMGDVRNTSITEWWYRATPFTTREPSWHLERFNDSAHLEGIA
jgi:broad specificity phosphatase PhoE